MESLMQYQLTIGILMMKVLEYYLVDDDIDVIGDQNCCYDVLIMLVKEWMVSCVEKFVLISCELLEC